MKCRSGFVIEDVAEPLHAKAGEPSGAFGHRSRFVAPYVRIKARRVGGSAAAAGVGGAVHRGAEPAIPEMDPTRPAQVDPKKIIEAVRDWQVTQAFGSPAIWGRVGQYCVDREIQLPTLRVPRSLNIPRSRA